MRRLAIVAALCACAPDETVSAYTPDARYVLKSVDGAAFDVPATIVFGDGGRVSGQGPCNSYTARLTVPYPWFELGPIAATRRACSDLGAEQAFFDALSRMAFAEAQGDTLILSNDAGGQMVFRAPP